MNDYIGASFDDFLEEENLMVEVKALTIKRALIKQTLEYIKQHKLTKAEFAKKMQIKLLQLDRFLDTENSNLSLKKLIGLAKAMDKQIKISFVD
ncbi:XRE family transcriptional regulator [Legionella cardiaca]|uniref:XRE family transcriptional regulator n=1 Tax=Legionella cardiaca TaxID=1071983 RepID=A0ABY8ATK9_9GAMM|nr:XRE family transcriptional regulator [Legionella cardiaca]WED44010.1 XRE family transcriptional regulator [Legionella cardiaca]